MNEYHIQYLLISWVSWEMDLPGDQIRLVRRNVFISSSRIRCKAWAVMGFNFPPSMFQRGASSLMSSDSSQLRHFPQSKCATRDFLSEVTPPVHSFAVISLPLQLTTKSGTLRVMWETLRRKWAKGQQAVISAEYSCNFEKRFKKAPKPSSFSVFWERLFCALL